MLSTGRTLLRTAWRRVRLLHSPKVNRFLEFARPGHYYSPIPSVEDIEANWNDEPIVDVNLQTRAQLELLEKLSPNISLSFLERSERPRFYVTEMFSLADACAYTAIVSSLPPNRVLEVGSGYSSALLLDLAEIESLDIEMTFVDPDPIRLRQLLRKDDWKSVSVLEKPVQALDLAKAEELEGGDILFIDSSHVAKLNSDVTFIFSQILPRLKAGVKIHIHDVFWPFEYPENWLREGRAWNEIYLLRTLLQHDEHYRILLFPDYLAKTAPRAVATHGPMLFSSPGSIWLEKLEPSPPTAL